MGLGTKRSVGLLLRVREGMDLKLKRYIIIGNKL
tara:strand:+ start:195 stop:296 length:102 start_codon:yes stop_codon:yes gene_type:complete